MRLIGYSFASVLFLSLVASQGSALAKNVATQGKTSSTLDLRVKELPQGDLSSLKMRVAAAEEEPKADAEVSAAPTPTRQSKSNLSAIPTDFRDIQERVIFKVNVGYNLESSLQNGDVGRHGFNPEDQIDANGNGYVANRNYLMGDAVLGSNGVLLPSMNTYFLSRFGVDVVEGASEFTTLNRVYDAPLGENVLVRSAYAELDGVGGMDEIFVRAGRQFRYGSSRFLTNFDGVSAAYDHKAVEVNGFFGQRVSSFFEDDPGIVAGGGIKLRGEELVDYPVDWYIDFLRFDSGNDDLEATQFIETKAKAQVMDGTRVYLRGRLIDDGEELGVGRVGGQVRHSFNDDLLTILDVEKNFAREVVFDYFGNQSVDVANVIEVGQDLGLAMLNPQNSTLISARANYMVNKTVETYGFFRSRLVKNADESDGFSRPFNEFGAAISALIGQRLSAGTQYKLRIHDLDENGNVEGTAFDDTTGTGTKQFHEVSANARYNFGKKKAAAGIGGYFRLYDFETPYATVELDGRAGGRVDVEYWPSKIMRLMANGEVAQPSQTFYADIDTLVSFRLMAEAQF